LSLTHRTIFDILGFLMLFLGILSAGVAVWSGQDRSASRLETPSADNGWKDDTLSPEDSKSSSRQSEVLSGKFGTLLTYWWRRCAEAVSTQGFAMILAMISVLVALFCFVVANRL
jgi:uncharacterized membrane protein YbaN (DUF454 family)